MRQEKLFGMQLVADGSLSNGFNCRIITLLSDFSLVVPQLSVSVDLFPEVYSSDCYCSMEEVEDWFSAV